MRHIVVVGHAKSGKTKLLDELVDNVTERITFHKGATPDGVVPEFVIVVSDLHTPSPDGWHHADAQAKAAATAYPTAALILVHTKMDFGEGWTMPRELSHLPADTFDDEEAQGNQLEEVNRNLTRANIDPRFSATFAVSTTTCYGLQDLIDHIDAC